jgi:hypothetical protein
MTLQLQNAHPRETRAEAGIESSEFRVQGNAKREAGERSAECGAVTKRYYCIRPITDH